jgi:hypothetical protein
MPAKQAVSHVLDGEHAQGQFAVPLLDAPGILAGHSPCHRTYKDGAISGRGEACTDGDEIAHADAVFEFDENACDRGPNRIPWGTRGSVL